MLHRYAVWCHPRLRPRCHVAPLSGVASSAIAPAQPCCTAARCGVIRNHARATILHRYAVWRHPQSRPRLPCCTATRCGVIRNHARGYHVAPLRGVASSAITPALPCCTAMRCGVIRNHAAATILHRYGVWRHPQSRPRYHIAPLLGVASSAIAPALPCCTAARWSVIWNMERPRTRRGGCGGRWYYLRGALRQATCLWRWLLR